MHARRSVLSLLACAGLSSPALSAQFIESSDVPPSAKETENVDFGDVDLDGDFDAVFANGADGAAQQNDLWLNAGGLQRGVLGHFIDGTAAGLPVTSDSTRDLEFADIDVDGDLDLYVVNTAQIVNQGSRWWINQGGAQGLAAGSFSDDTAARWVGLNAAASSIPDALLIPNAIEPEAFIDWGHDGDFGDIDADGDLDLVHTSSGGSYSGSVPTRIFLNDGAGYFSEFNPSGFKLPGISLADGSPGLWCEGTQLADTTDVDGSTCDITVAGVDLDLGDFDGDFDLDFVMVHRKGVSRFYDNRSEETGSLTWRDVTQAAYVGQLSANNNFEQELGDLDGDDDLDIYGLNWDGFSDVSMLNDGSGTFGSKATLPSSGADDEEGDFLDYDADGDLDLFVAGWSGSNRLYRNTLIESGSFSFELQSSGLGFGTSKDVQVADVDGDGDTDVLLAQAGNGINDLLLNTTQIADTTPARIPAVEAVQDGPAAAAGIRVRAAVLDNASSYETAFNTTLLTPRVQGILLPSLPMTFSGGQIFRGTLPGNFVGTVGYRVTSSDGMGNLGASAPSSFTATGDTGTQGGATTPSSVGTPALASLSAPFAGAPLYLRASGVAAGTSGVFLASLASLPGLDLGDGAVLNIAPPFLLTAAALADSNGASLFIAPSTAPSIGGLTIHLQYLALDGFGGNTWASASRLTLTFQ